MKKLWISFVCLLLVVAFAGKAEAAQKVGVVQEDVNRTFVPVRYTVEQFGYEVGWEPKLQQITLKNNETSIAFILNSKLATVNGKSYTLEAAPFQLQGTTYVPLRFVVDYLDIQMSWSKEGITFQSKEQTTLLKTVGLSRMQQALAAPYETTSTKLNVNNKTYSVNTVKIDLYHPSIDFGVAYANNKIGTTEPLADMAVSSGSKIAINGTYFDAYTADDNRKVPYGYIIHNGQIIHKAPGEQRAAFVYTTDGQALIVDGEKELKPLIEQNIVHTALQVGPRLLRNGKVDTNPELEGFKDPKVLTNAGSRSALGITSDHKLLLVTTNGATITQLAHIMQQLGAMDAMNLDGGASSGLYVNGKYVTAPGRDLSNALYIKF